MPLSDAACREAPSANERGTAIGKMADELDSSIFGGL